MGGGEVRAGPLMGQSVSSQSINGVTSKSINIAFPVYSSSSPQPAQAQVVSQEMQSTVSSRITVSGDGRCLAATTLNGVI